MVHRRYSTCSLALLAVISCARAASLDVRVEGESGEGLNEAVVVAVPRFVHRLPAPKPDIVEQAGQEFVPRVKVVLVGTPVTFPNRDEVKHHVYSFSPTKKFEIELYRGTPAAAIIFNQPGEVVLGCNIHDWMTGYVYVSDSPFFAKTDAAGRARLTNLPEGAYSVRVWHPASLIGEHLTQRNINLVEPSAQVAWKLKTRPETRIRRAPAAGSGGYR